MEFSYRYVSDGGGQVLLSNAKPVSVVADEWKPL